MKKFCSKCGANLRTDAKFCTTCGSKVVIRKATYQSQYINNRSGSRFIRQDPKVDTFQERKITRPTTRPIKSNFEKFSKSTTKLNYLSSDNTFAELNLVESDIESLELLIMDERTNEKINFLNSKINVDINYDQVINNFLQKYKDTGISINSNDWRTFSKYSIELGNSLNLEIIYIIAYYLKKENKQVSKRNKEMIFQLKSDLVDIDSSKLQLSSLKEKQKRIHTNLFSAFPKINLVNQYVEFVKKANKKKIQLLSNKAMLEKLQVGFKNLQSNFQAILKELMSALYYNINDFFPGNIIDSLNENKLKLTLEELIKAQINVNAINYYFNNIFINETFIIPDIKSFLLFNNLINEYTFENSINNTYNNIKLIESNLDISINNIKSLLKKQSNEIIDLISYIDEIKQLIGITRKNILMGSKTRPRQLKNYKISIETHSSFIHIEYSQLQLEFLTKNIESDLKQIIAGEFIIPESVLKLKENLLKSIPQPVKKVKAKNYFKTSLKEHTNSQSIIQFPTMPKMISMTSLFLKKDKTESVNPTEANIKKELESIKFSFKKMYFESETKISFKFYSGSMKYITWEFSDEFNIDLDWKFESKKELDFSLIQDSERANYSWKDPYNLVTVITNYSTEKKAQAFKKKLFRESRIAEKMNRIPGSVTVVITNSNITIKADKNKIIIKPSLDFIKELVFILNISLKY